MIVKIFLQDALLAQSSLLETPTRPDFPSKTLLSNNFVPVIFGGVAAAVTSNRRADSKPVSGFLPRPPPLQDNYPACPLV
jgi:hypothetical protein